MYSARYISMLILFHRNIEIMDGEFLFAIHLVIPFNEIIISSIKKNVGIQIKH